MINKKIQYIRTLEAQFERLNTYLEVLDVSMKNADTETKMKYDEKMKDIRNKRDMIREKISRVKESKGNTWEVIGEEAGNFWGSIKNTFKNAKEEYKKGYEEGLDN